jgi:hypothetical protein
MARIRTVKPAHWSDRELPKISLQAHLLWIATWNFSDDDGVFDADPLFLKSQIFPRRTDIRVEQIKLWLDQLEKARFIIPFEYKGEGYYVSRTFKIHQKIDRPQPGIIPLDELERIIDEHSSNDRRTLDPVEESKGEEGSGVEGGGEPPHTPTPEEMEFADVQKWIQEKAPRVARMKEPLTMKEYFKLKESYEVDDIPRILQAMHNWGNLMKRQSAYLTFLTFIKRDDKYKAA